MILFFDDEKDIRANFKKEISGQKISLEVLECSTKAEVREKLRDKELMSKMKVLVFDLSTSREEAESGNFEILEDIKNNYSTYAIPIFIHSAFANIVVGYDNLGTLFKVAKTENSIAEIASEIKLFEDSGFLNIFCSQGSLELEIHKEILKAFKCQFKGDEIKQIIESIQHGNKENLIARTKDVFERIAIRSLYQNLISAKQRIESKAIDEIKINSVEHYYRRQSDFKTWTGDIFERSADNSQFIIITPRCDINNGTCNDRFLSCSINELDNKLMAEIVKDSNKFLNDNPQKSGIKTRFLIPAPNYRGGKVDLSDYFFVEKNDFTAVPPVYKYLISLSDELTNDIVRKFASFILRGGISTSDLSEASFYSMSNTINNIT